MLEEALDHLVRGIVGHPDDVRVVSRMLRRGNVLEVRVHPDDLGKVIGRGGRTARALRTVVGSLAGNRHIRIDLLETGETKADKKDRYEELVKESLAAKEAKAAAKPVKSAPKKDTKKAEPAEAAPAEVAAEAAPAESAPAESTGA